MASPPALRASFCQDLLRGDREADALARRFGDFLRELSAREPRVLYQIGVKRNVVEDFGQLALPKELRAEFLEVGLLAETDHGVMTGGMVHRNLVHTESGQWFVLTDWPDVPVKGYPGVAAVFPIHFESVFLLRRVRRGRLWMRAGRVGDFFCGSGVFGVFAAFENPRQVVCFDSEPRALAFTRLNSLVNGVEDLVRVEEWDVFDTPGAGAATIESLDLVFANPPFEAVPDDTYPRHSAGGTFGDLPLLEFVQKLGRYLSEDGVAFTVAFSVGKRLSKGVTQKAIGRSIHLVQGLEKVLTASPARLRCAARVIAEEPLERFALRFQELGLRGVEEWWVAQNARGYEVLYFLTADFRVAEETSHCRWSRVTTIDERGRVVPEVSWTEPVDWPGPVGVSLGGPAGG